MRTAFMCFKDDFGKNVRLTITDEHPEWDQFDVAKEFYVRLSVMWEELSLEDQSHYIAQASKNEEPV